MRAVRQGDLDGLCGVYALINAMEMTGIVGPRSDFHRRLFKRLLQTLSERQLRRAMTNGLNQYQLVEIGQRAFRSIGRAYGIKLSVEALDDTWSPHDFTGFVQALSAHALQPRSAVIINLVMPGMDHWTVVQRCDLQRLVLRDSGRLRQLSLDRFALAASRYRITPSCTLVVRRLNGPTRLRAIDLG